MEAERPVEDPPNTTLGGRYRLLDRSGADVDTGAGRLSTWRARDTLLDRDVLLRIHAPGGPAARLFLDRALAAGVLSHPALAMVYDAVDEDRRAYVVSEWVEGTSLTEALREGPMTDLDARETVRRVAEGVAQAHGLGLAVGGLVPDRVMIAPSGTVTVTAIPAPRAGVQSDLRALGALLYAALSTHWPDPNDPDDRPDRLPRDASPDLAAIALQAMDPDAEQGIGSAEELVRVLLAGRGDDLGFEGGGLSFITDRYDDEPPDDRPDAWLVAEDTDPEITRQITALPKLPAVAGATPARPPVEDDRDDRSRWIVLAFPAVALLVVVALLAWLFGGSLGPDDGTPAAQTTQPQATTPGAEATAEPTATSAAPTPAALPITSAVVFDPFGDGAPENDDEAGLAFDGDPGTAWPTLQYRGSAELGNLKPGVGLLFDLGAPAAVSEVSIATPLPGSTVEVRSGAAPTEDLDALAVVGTGTLSDQTTIAVDGEPARYWLVWITTLVPVEDFFQASLGEVVFTGVPAE
ncbi:hypothetical protein BH20ACT5_BH20ACT5_24440 [soil metagenome]